MKQGTVSVLFGCHSQIQVQRRSKSREEVRAGNRKEKEDDRHKAGEDSGDIV